MPDRPIKKLYTTLILSIPVGGSKIKIIIERIYGGNVLNMYGPFDSRTMGFEWSWKLVKCQTIIVDIQINLSTTVPIIMYVILDILTVSIDECFMKRMNQIWNRFCSNHNRFRVFQAHTCFKHSHKCVINIASAIGNIIGLLLQSTTPVHVCRFWKNWITSWGGTINISECFYRNMMMMTSTNFLLFKMPSL